MGSENKSYRIRTEVGEKSPAVINVQLNQTYDMLSILSLNLNQQNEYKFYECDYGVIVGRVLAGTTSFGIPNAKISIFIEVEDSETFQNRFFYNYTDVNDRDNNNVRYNVLPDFVDDECHQNVGTFPNKRLVLDNDNQIEVFGKYWKYTTTTNESGDYMLFGVPTGSQQLHVDLDLSDIGVLSQRPRDMVYKGYDLNQFDSPNKFKSDDNLNSLSQIYTQDRGLYVYPYWGETGQYGDTIAITRCDINIDYTFEPTCIFMGSIISDGGSNSINQKCIGGTYVGNMADMVAGEGTIEMIRKTIDNKVEQFQVKGDRVIDGNGVWCYQIPMNLDYVMTDEYGNIVPTDDPAKGIPTRTRVRFRVTMNETPTDGTARKRSKYLVPNNPRIDANDFPVFTKTLEPDYEFGTNTNEESYKDLFWNNVYTVKCHIPKLQTSNSFQNKKHTGIKLTNHYGDNNPMPFNSLTIKLGFTYRMICLITKLVIDLIEFLNQLFSMVGGVTCILYKFLNKTYNTVKVGPIHLFFFLKPFIKALEVIIPRCIKITSGFCDDGINRITYYPGCGKLLFNIGSMPGMADCVWELTEEHHVESERKQYDTEEEYLENASQASNETAMLYTCVENSLAQENESTSFNFDNDWVNGVLYLPLWYRKIRPKKSFLFGLFKRKAKDQWCTADNTYSSLRLYEACSIDRKSDGTYTNFEGKTIRPYWTIAPDQCKNDKCQNVSRSVKGMNGLIVTRETMLGDTVYYYKSVEYSYSIEKNVYRDDDIPGDIKILFATDIVLLGSLNDCDLHGVPQFFKYLESTTYNLPSDILDTDQEITLTLDADGNAKSTTSSFVTIETGCDWGNTNDADQCGSPDGGLFYSIGCSTIEMIEKSCVNLRRICEFGVSKDVTKVVEDLNELSSDENADDTDWDLIPDGYVSYDELYNLDERSMFATMNGNNLRTKLNNTNGLMEYDFRYLYPENFDGSLKEIMTKRQTNKCSMTYRYNYNLEAFSADYYQFRMGDKPYFYDNENGGFPRFENSFYFYFGLKEGKTAIDQFNSQFFSSCEDVSGSGIGVSVTVHANSWCSELTDNDDEKDGYVEIDATGIETPYDLVINCTSNSTISYSIQGLIDEKIVICNKETYDKLIGEDMDYSFENPESCQFNLSNGDYEVTITDGNGSISSFTFSCKNAYLSYATDRTDFLIANNVLLSTYGTYDGIASVSANRDTIGGTIRVYGFANGSETLRNYRVTIYCEDIEYSYPYVIVSGGSISGSGGSGFLSSFSTAQDMTFGVPWGGATYIVTVTELCDGIDSMNTVTQSIYVEEVSPFKLYINDIDYDLISDWESGYNDDGTPNGKEPKQWLSMSDESNYNWGGTTKASDLCDNILTELIYYDIYELGTTTKVTKKDSTTIFNYMESNVWASSITASDILALFTIDSDVTEEEITQLTEDIQSLLDGFSTYKEETISSVKSAFMLVCEDMAAHITISVQTNSYPVTYNMAGREEETSTDNEETRNTLANDVSEPEFWPETQSVSEILIPTITTVDSENYGNQTYIIPSHSALCYTTDNRSKFRNKLKFPYYVAAMNGDNETLPTEVDGTFATSNEHYFIVHILDKLFTMDMMAWSYIDDVPYFAPLEEEKIGQSITMNGLLTGVIMNGVVVSGPDDEGIVEFDDQVLGNDTVTICNFQTGTDYEDNLPTKRTFIGKNNKEYPGYHLNFNDNNIDPSEYYEYASVPNRTLDLMISDQNYCSVYATVYGNMKISLGSSSLNDCKNNEKHLFVSADNSGTDVVYYIFSTTGGDTYPLNAINYGELDMTGNANLEWNGENSGRIFSYLTTKDTFLNLCDKNVSSISYEDENGTTTMTTMGYGDIGSFDISGQDSAYFVVAVNSDNIRAISPVYDFSDVNVDIAIVKETIKGELLTDEDRESYKFGVGFLADTDAPYYMKNYSFTLSANCSAVSGNTIGGTLTYEMDEESTGEGVDGNFVYFSITETMYQSLELLHTLAPDTIPSKTTVSIVDYSGLTHNCCIGNVRFYSITYETTTEPQ